MEAELEAGEAAALALLVLVLHVGAVMVVGVLIGIVVGRLLVLATHHHGFFDRPRKRKRSVGQDVSCLWPFLLSHFFVFILFLDFNPLSPSHSLALPLSH